MQPLSRRWEERSSSLQPCAGDVGSAPASAVQALPFTQTAPVGKQRTVPRVRWEPVSGSCSSPPAPRGEKRSSSAARRAQGDRCDAYSTMPGSFRLKAAIPAPAARTLRYQRKSSPSARSRVMFSRVARSCSPILCKARGSDSPSARLGSARHGPAAAPTYPHGTLPAVRFCPQLRWRSPLSADLKPSCPQPRWRPAARPDTALSGSGAEWEGWGGGMASAAGTGQERCGKAEGCLEKIVAREGKA